MNFKMVFQLIISTIVFSFSTAIAWYEGSALLDRPHEWKHTALLSQMLNGQVAEARDIVQFDFFIYAAKFSPSFPLLMLISGTYLFLLVAYVILKKNRSRFWFSLIGLGILFFILSVYTSNSPTVGLKLFFYTSLLIGSASLAVGFFNIWRGKSGSFKSQLNYECVFF